MRYDFTIANAIRTAAQTRARQIHLLKSEQHTFSKAQIRAMQDFTIANAILSLSQSQD